MLILGSFNINILLINIIHILQISQHAQTCIISSFVFLFSSMLRPFNLDVCRICRCGLGLAGVFATPSSFFFFFQHVIRFSHCVTIAPARQTNDLPRDP